MWLLHITVLGPLRFFGNWVKIRSMTDSRIWQVQCWSSHLQDFYCVSALLWLIVSCRATEKIAKLRLQPASFRHLQDPSAVGVGALTFASFEPWIPPAALRLPPSLPRTENLNISGLSLHLKVTEDIVVYVPNCFNIKNFLILYAKRTKWQKGMQHLRPSQLSKWIIF